MGMRSLESGQRGFVRTRAALLLNQTVLILLVIFAAALVFLMLSRYWTAAGVWEEVYTKEIVRVVNSAEPGDEIALDVHHATVIAQKNDVKNPKYIIRFDSARHEVVVALRLLGGTRFAYVNDVVITDVKIEEERGVNVLRFRVAGWQAAERGAAA